MPPDPVSPEGKSQIELSESEIEVAAILLGKLLGIDAEALFIARLRSGTALQERPRIVGLAARVRRHRLRRRELFPQPIFGEPPWEMLLALYLDFPDGTTIATLASSIGLAGTTVRRWLGYLKDHHLVKAVPLGHDRRSLCVLLTDSARERLDRYFNDIELIWMVNDPLWDLRQRASQCRRLAALTHDEKMAKELLKWADELEADMERLSTPTPQNREHQ